MFINELAQPTLLVVYPGRFQPFHKGHYAVYEWLTGKFGRNNVYITTSNKTDGAKSPFTFSEKSYFMQLTGVPADRIVQATQPYQIQNVLQSGQISVTDPDNTVVIFAVSQKDMDEDPRFSFAPKKDGSDPYFQPLKDIKDTVSMSQHGYIMTVPTFDFTVAGKPMRSGTELRNLYASSDESGRQAIITDLFGKYTQEAEQIMNNKIPTQQAEPVAESRGDPEREHLLARARVAHPLAASDEEALALYINDREQRDVNRLDQENDQEEEEINSVEQLAQELRARLDRLETKVGVHEEAGGVGVVANKKQAKDPRYSMSLTKDVRPGQIDKNLRAFNLKETDWSLGSGDNKLQLLKLTNKAFKQVPGSPAQKATMAQISELRKKLGMDKRVKEGAVDALAAQQAEHISQDIAELKQRISTEQLPATYVEALKKKIAQLEQERARITLGR